MHVRNPHRLLTVALATLPPLSVTASESKSADRDLAAITRQLDRYEQALNTSDIDTVMKLYAEDAVFMPRHSSPAEGRNAVRTAYRRSCTSTSTTSPSWSTACHGYLSRP